MLKLEIKKLENSEIEINGIISVENLETYREKATKKLSKNIEIQGFRKGHIPDKILMQKIGKNRRRRYFRRNG